MQLALNLQVSWKPEIKTEKKKKHIRRKQIMYLYERKNDLVSIIWLRLNLKERREGGRDTNMRR